MTMTSRERVLAAINHREPDRVPLDLGGSRVTGIDVSAYTRLRRHLGLRLEPAKVVDVWQMLAWVEDPVVQALGADVLPVPRLNQEFGTRVDTWQPWQLDDGTAVQMPGNFHPVEGPAGARDVYLDGELVARKAASSVYFDRMIEFKVYDPLPPVETFPMPVFTEEELRWRQHWAETLRHETDKAIVGDFGYPLGRWGSYQEWMTTVGTDPDYVLAYNERKIENMLTNMALFAEAVGDHIDVVWLGEDLGTQQGLMISPHAVRTLIAPYYKRLFDWVHQHTAWKVFFHCCGGIYPIIDTLIEAGVDILNPVQTTARGMDPVRLKAEFGDRLVFWGGGIDTQTVLPYGTLPEIREQVRERIQILGRGGGFVFNPVHNIQGDISPDRLIAMYETVRRYGNYPLED
ncbi:MAG: uroporphyrinogen decarboxylase family protein [Anaerolineae bacterium]